MDGPHSSYSCLVIHICWKVEREDRMEPLIANGDDLAIGQLVGLLKGGGSSSGGHLLLEVKGNIAELLLDVTDNLTLSGGGERVAPLGEDLHEVVGQLTAS